MTRRAERLHGHWIVEPWPEPADGDALLRDIIRHVRRHVVCSAEPESGKSTTLGLISFLAPR
jgi:hypothetical protein